MDAGKTSCLVSPSGGPIHRHGAARPWQAPRGEVRLTRISAHIETHLGPVETVFQEILSDAVHVDVHVVRETRDCPHQRLITSGMSDLPMAVPRDCDAPRHLELMVTLPASWRLGPDAFEDEAWYWPLRLLKTLARLPHRHDTWLGHGHAVPHGDPPLPYADNTRLCGAMLLPALSTPPGFRRLRIDAMKEIHFLSVVPLYEEEMNLKLRAGSDALLERFDRAGIEHVIDPARRNLGRKRFGLF